MSERASHAADRAPSLTDRLQHHDDLMREHPLIDTSREGVQPPSHPSASSNRTSSAHSGSDFLLASTGIEKQFLRVPVELIDENPYNARHIYRAERVAELSESIGAHGQDHPGIATIRNGRYVLAAGHYRLRAIKVRNLATMDLMIHEGLSDRNLYEASYRENSEREIQTPMDNALAWRGLLDRGVYDNETAIAEATGMSLPNVNKTLSLLKLSPPVLDLVRENPSSFALSALYELTLFEKVGPSDQALSLAQRLSQGEIGRTEVNEARRRFEDARTRKQKEMARAFKIVSHAGPEIGVIKEWDSGKVLLEVQMDDPQHRSELVAMLKERFGVR